ncbi:uncharacterized protein LOC135079549 [Ostrinia nubilalis]|uniref:uncharacterized protein LOC135079549 n=1 Tax=Ostrinia nubilalis TaxID=29057 RepID=UPI0030825C26
MNLSLLLIYCFIICTHSAKQKHVTPNKTVPVPEAKKVEENKPEERKTQNKVNPKDIPDLLSKLPRKKIIQLIQPEAVTQWAKEISESLLENEELVVQSKEIIAGFSNIRIAARNGSAIVEQMARNLEDLLTRRVKAAEAIMRRAEALASEERHPPPDYTYDYSIELNELKKKLETESQWDLPEHCRSLRKLHLRRSEHFDADVSLDHSSVHAAAEVFDCSHQLDKKQEAESKWDLPEHCRSLRKLHLRRSEHFDADVSLDHSSVHAAAEVFDCSQYPALLS